MQLDMRLEVVRAAELLLTELAWDELHVQMDSFVALEVLLPLKLAVAACPGALFVGELLDTDIRGKEAGRWAFGVFFLCAAA